MRFARGFSLKSYLAAISKPWQTHIWLKEMCAEQAWPEDVRLMYPMTALEQKGPASSEQRVREGDSNSNSKFESESERARERVIE